MTGPVAALRRAAFTEDGSLLFVHAGVDTSRPFFTQSDSFWWGATDFSKITEPFEGVNTIVRGYSAQEKAIRVTSHTATLDGGCGFGGPLNAACFDHSGVIVDHISV